MITPDPHHCQHDCQQQLLLIIEDLQKPPTLSVSITRDNTPRQQPLLLHQDYIPRTLNDTNLERCHYLPAFPCVKSCPINQIPLLLANVSAAMLTAHGLQRRYATYYDGPCVSTIMSEEIESFVYSRILYEFSPIMQRLKISAALLDYNLQRFDRIAQRYQHLRNHFYERHSRSEQLSDANTIRFLDFHEMVIGLEMFLQVDVDIFFMKTCSYRGASPRSLDEGVFCKSNLPSLRYNYQPCQQFECSLCESSTSISILEQCTNRTFRFVNGYQTILNCPVTCQTNNFIFALVCPCLEYEFVGSTNLTVRQFIEQTRHMTNQYLSQALISGRHFHSVESDSNECSLSDYDKYRLYQHAAHCSKTIDMFVKMNPQYACFVPITYEEAQCADSLVTDQQIDFDSMIEYYIQNVPIPPNGYTFSFVQRQQQRIFFHNFHHKQDFDKPWIPCDLYHTSIIAVLPDNCTNLLREILACLLSTHAETKLNMFNLRTNNIQQLYGPPYHKLWYEHLIRPIVQNVKSS